MARYHRYGQIAYEPTTELLRALEKTSLSNVKASEIRLPAPTFWLHLEDLEETLEIWGGVTGLHKVSGCYISEEVPFDDKEQTEENRHLSIVVYGMPNANSEHSLDDANFWFHLPLTLMGTGADLEAHIQQRMQDDSKAALSDSIDWKHPAVKQKMLDVNRRITRIVLNFLLFLTCDACKPRTDLSAHTEITKIKKRIDGIKNQKKHAKDIRRLTKEMELLPTARVIHVGERMVLERAKKPAAVTGRKMSWHWVGFHWQHIWRGPRKDAEGNPQPGTERVLKLIAPYAAGSEDVASAKTYKIGGTS